MFPARPRHSKIIYLAEDNSRRPTRGFGSDAADPYGIVARLVTALPAGSYLVLAHPASDIRAVQMAEMTKREPAHERAEGNHA